MIVIHFLFVITYTFIAYNRIDRFKLIGRFFSSVFVGIFASYSSEWLLSLFSVAFRDWIEFVEAAFHLHPDRIVMLIGHLVVSFLVGAIPLLIAISYKKI